MASKPQGDEDRGAHVAKQHQQQQRSRRQQSLKQWADLGHKALAAEEWATAHAILDAKIVPRIDTSSRDLRVARHQARAEDLPFDQAALGQWLAARSGRATVHLSPGVATDEPTLEDVDVEVASPPVAPRTLFAAFRSVYTMLALDEGVDVQAASEVPIYEYEHQVGVRYYSALSPGSEAVDLIDEDDDRKATLFTGGQGSGKSTALETITEDRLARGHKLIDLVDFLKAENVTRDIPSQDEDLNEIRADMGLDVGFEDFDPPDMEIRVPLTPDIADQQVPYDTEREEFVVKPFVVPASELTYRQLVMVLPHVTKTHEQHLQAAHQILSNSGKDWTLKDMAKTVRHETNAGDTLSDRIERSLETVQNKSFIRDTQSPDEYILDWPEIMDDTETATAFTFSPLEERADRLLMASYLLDSLYDERRKLLRRKVLHRYPPLTVAIRELHEIVPRGKAEQEAEATIEGYMIDTMSELIALVRHADMELLCDTQKFKQQLSPSVSGLFHRIFAFGGQRPDIKKVFSTRIGSSEANDYAPTVAKFDPGECALVSGDGFSMPLQMAPPRSHHLDAKTDGNGLGFRVRHLEHEEDREAPWDGDIPARLQFDEAVQSPIGRFWRDHVDHTGDPDDIVLKDDITEAYHKWSDLHDEPAKQHKMIHGWVTNNIDVEQGRTRRHDRDAELKSCYKGVKLTL